MCYSITCYSKKKSQKANSLCCVYLFNYYKFKKRFKLVVVERRPVRSNSGLKSLNSGKQARLWIEKLLAEGREEKQVTSTETLQGR